MKALMKFISSAFAVFIFLIGTITVAGGSLPTPVPRPTPAPRPTPPLRADIGSSYSNSKPPYSIDRHAILTAMGYPSAYSLAIGYADLNGDGIPDLIFAPISGTTTGLSIIIALGQPGGSYIDGTTQIISGEVPAPVHPRKILVADFNRDGWPDIFIADHGYDAPPFAGNHNWLLLSDGSGHLVYQSAFATTEPVGFHHGATAGDIDQSGRLDIFVTDNIASGPYFLLNDGHGNFSVDRTRVPISLRTVPYPLMFTCELMDVDYDGNLDLVVSGHEYDGMPTEIFWGNGSGFYSDANKTVLPAEAQFGIAIDIDSEDINHDGLRDLVITRTAQLPQFYTGFYFQVLMQTSPRAFADESLPRLIHDLTTWIGNTGTWVDWIHLTDTTGDSALDLVVDDAGRQLGWVNDGNGFFTFTGGWSQVIWTTPLVGGTFSPPAPGTYSYDVNWNEAIDPASVQPTDLTLSGIQGATVTTVAVINQNFTTEFTLNIPTGGSLTASIAAGAITAQSGHPNVAFSGSYPVSPWAPPTPRPHPTPPPR